MKRYAWTVIGFVLSLSLLLYTLIGQVDLFEQFTLFLQNFESFELDEFILPALLFSLFAVYDRIRRERLKRIEHSRIAIFKSMLKASDHILKNFLNQMQLFKLTAEETPEFDPEVIRLFEQIVDDTTDQLKALRELKEVNPETIKKALKPNQ